MIPRDLPIGSRVLVNLGDGAERSTTAMNVKELRDALAGLPDDMPVILQKDAEGNGYSPLYGVDGENAAYVARTTWDGEVKRRRLSDEDRAAGFCDEDVSTDGAPCVVLWPVN